MKPSLSRYSAHRHSLFRRHGIAAAALSLAVSAAFAGGPAMAKELSLAYFVGPKHPMNAAVFTPFAEKLAELSGGELTVKAYPGGALNSDSAKQYSIMLKGVADIVFGFAGYTGALFPLSNTISVPGVCEDAVDCTEALWRAMPIIEKEYDAKVLAMWSNDPPVLLSRDKPIRRLEDIEGLKLRVTSKQDVPFAEALSASAVSLPAPVLNQALANGTIDAIAIDPSAIGSFKLWEPAKYVTVGYPGAGKAIFLLLNRQVYEGLSEQERAWVDAASGKWLSESAGLGFRKAGDAGLKAAADNGVEIIVLPPEERQRLVEAQAEVMADYRAEKLPGGMTGGELIDIMRGK